MRLLHEASESAKSPVGPVTATVTGCDEPISPRDNIPVLSWLLLRGKCRNCGAPISARYPLVEALTAVLMAMVPIFLGPDQDMWIGYAMVLVLVPLTFIDLDHRILPNKITYPAVLLAIGVTAAFYTDHTDFRTRAAQPC